MPNDVKVYTTNHCGYCVSAKQLLSKRGIPYEEVNVEDDDEKRAWLVKASGQRTVPQIFINGTPIGGASELHALDKSGELAKLLGTVKSA